MLVFCWSCWCPVLAVLILLHAFTFLKSIYLPLLFLVFGFLSLLARTSKHRFLSFFFLPMPPSGAFFQINAAVCKSIKQRKHSLEVCPFWAIIETCWCKPHAKFSKLYTSYILIGIYKIMSRYLWILFFIFANRPLYIALHILYSRPLNVIKLSNSHNWNWN